VKGLVIGVNKSSLIEPEVEGDNDERLSTKLFLKTGSEK
jgi:hypothetical protein